MSAGLVTIQMKLMTMRGLTMNPKERVLARLRQEPVDRAPNFSILMTFAAKYAGYTMDKFCKSYRVLVDSNIKSAEAFGIDIMSTMSDAYRETADFGAPISFPYDSLPVCGHLITDPADVKKLKPLRIEASPRMMDRLYAIELYKREVGAHYPIMGWVEGCLAEASDLMGLTDLTYAIYDEPHMVKEILDICLVSAKTLIRAQIEAGADIIGVGDAVASVLGPRFYDEWALPYEQALFNEIKRHGAVGRLHICGNIAPLLDSIKHSGADIVDVDYMVDFSEARRKLEGYSLVCGNFDPVSVILNGTPDDVRAAVTKCLSEGNDRCFIMPGCEVPKMTPVENLLEISRTLKNAF